MKKYGVETKGGIRIVLGGFHWVTWFSNFILKTDYPHFG